MHFDKSCRIMLPFSDFSSIITAFNLADSTDFLLITEVGQSSRIHFFLVKMVIWRAFIGESDDNAEDFHGFTLEEVTKGKEPDADLDIVVRGGILESDKMSCSRTIPVTMAEVMKVIALLTMICMCLVLHENINKLISRPRKQQ